MGHHFGLFLDFILDSFWTSFWTHFGLHFGLNFESFFDILESLNLGMDNVSNRRLESASGIGVWTRFVESAGCVPTSGLTPSVPNPLFSHG